jgi:hypothetical protein
MTKSPEQYAAKIREQVELGDLAAREDPRVRRHAANAGELLIEARGQLTPDEFAAWTKLHFNMNRKAARRFIAAAYRARRAARK